MALCVTYIWLSHDVPKRTLRIQSPRCASLAVRIHALVKTTDRLCPQICYPKTRFQRKLQSLVFHLVQLYPLQDRCSRPTFYITSPLLLPLPLLQSNPYYTMPAIVHLAPRLELGNSSGGISGSAIAVLVIVGIIPVFALIWVCVWLLFGYSRDRNCCCVRRKRVTPEPAPVEGSMPSDATLNEKNDYTLPQRPISAWRTDSGSSTEQPRDSRTLKKHHPRESIQSQWSSSSTVPVVQEMQEPKQMV